MNPKKPIKQVFQFCQFNYAFPCIAPYKMATPKTNINKPGYNIPSNHTINHYTLLRYTIYNIWYYTVEQTLPMSWTEYLFNLLQLLLSPSAAEQIAGSWLRRLHLRSTQLEQGIKLCTNSFQIWEWIDVVLYIDGSHAVIV